MSRKNYHLFQSPVLNMLFCEDAVQADEMCRLAIDTFEDKVMPIPEGRKAAFITYTMAHIETAFDWGIRFANRTLHESLTHKTTEQQ
jgi:hypothetical protein